MREIKLLSKETIDRIAAGEVVERPSSVVKELMENSIDSGASSVSVEIKNGGIDLIRVTDNGSGIEKDQIEKAFLRHSTSKIENADDLSFIKTLGFRGEALSSICAVSKLELLTKTAHSVTGSIYKINGGVPDYLTDAGLPEGTTVIVRDLFYNVPARLKFLKTPRTEAGYISDIIEKMALSHPDISIKFINNGDVRLLTLGKGSLKDAIYAVYGRDIAANLLEVNERNDILTLSGFVGKPEVSRSLRSLENFFINGRYVKDKVISGAVEEAYRGFQMKGSFPFACINIEMEPELVDVNVHPSKMEVKFFDSERVYESIYAIISKIIKYRENIPAVTAETGQPGPEAAPKTKLPEVLAREIPGRGTDHAENAQSAAESGTEQFSGPAPAPEPAQALGAQKITFPEPFEEKRLESIPRVFEAQNTYRAATPEEGFQQQSIFEDRFVSEKANMECRIVGQVFSTYWIVEYQEKMYIIDQHAAHEKVLYEKFMKNIAEGEILSQNIAPPIIVTLSALEELALSNYGDYFRNLGFQVEHFGGSEYAISAVPATLYSSINEKEFFLSALDELASLSASKEPEILKDRVALASCKAAVKGGNTISLLEAQELIKSLLSLENPYNCPHGRPTIISMSKYELEKKFKRIV